jgi:hypothetical protein
MRWLVDDNILLHLFKIPLAALIALLLFDAVMVVILIGGLVLLMVLVIRVIKVLFVGASACIKNRLSNYKGPASSGGVLVIDDMSEKGPFLLCIITSM